MNNFKDILQFYEYKERGYTIDLSGILFYIYNDLKIRFPKFVFNLNTLGPQK